MIQNGGNGVISVAANVVPSLISEICSLASNLKYDDAYTINAGLENLYELLFVESNPVPVKWMLYKMKYVQNSIRLPLVQLDEKYHENVINEMLRLKLI